MKPILFNTEMVRALLEGRKTVTRRVVKPQPEARPTPVLPGSCWPGYFAVEGTPKVVRPPYNPSDILWVRETFRDLPVLPDGTYTNRVHYYYKADGDLRPAGWRDRWRPSIHMPREAARLFLRVTDVRVERLRDLTITDLQNEGIMPEGYISQYSALTSDYFEQFRELWDRTIKPADLTLYGWEANPWVWVIEFEWIGKDEALGGGVDD